MIQLRYMSVIVSLDEMFNSAGFVEKSRHGYGWIEAVAPSGDGEVLLMHGVTGGAKDMLPLALRYLDLGYRKVYSLSLPGHGKSSLEGGLRDYDGLAFWLTGAYDVIGMNPKVVVSNSYASSVVYGALTRGKLPEGTEYIIGCPTPEISRLSQALDMVGEYFPPGLAWWAYNTEVVQNIRAHALLRMSKKENPEAWAWLLDSEAKKKQYTTMQATNQLTRILRDNNPFGNKLPKSKAYNTTVVIGDQDTVVSQRTRSRISQYVSGSRYVTVPGVGHILHFEAVESLTPVQ